MKCRGVGKEMESSARGTKIVVLAFCSACAALAVTLGLFFARGYKETRTKTNSSSGRDEPRRENDETRDQTCPALDLELAKVLEENGHGELTRGTIYSLLGLLHKVEDYTLEKLLVVLMNCSAFTTNQNIIRECGGLPQLVGLLMHRNKIVSIKAAQVLSNLALNERNQESMKDCISDILRNLEYHDSIDQDEEVVVEHLKLLVNLSVTNVVHNEIMNGAQEYFNLLSQSLSGSIEKEVLRLLVNLSFNPNNLERLLELKPLLILQTFMLPDNRNEIILRAVTVTANLLANPNYYAEQQGQPAITEHLNILNGELIHLLDHSNEDIQSQAKRALRSIFAFRMMYSTQHDSL